MLELVVFRQSKPVNSDDFILKSIAVIIDERLSDALLHLVTNPLK